MKSTTLTMLLLAATVAKSAEMKLWYDHPATSRLRALSTPGLRARGGFTVDIEQKGRLT